MKIYFVGSISGKAKYIDNYKSIISACEKLGHKVLEYTISPSKQFVHLEMTDDERVDQYKRVLGFLKQSNVMVAEASYSSLGVGYEISMALEMEIPVVVLYSEGSAPHFLEGIKSEKLLVEKYSLENVNDVLSDALEYASNMQDTRFNFFVSPRIATYLDWVARTKRIPRAVYLRNLIRERMHNDKEYNKQ